MRLSRRKPCSEKNRLEFVILPGDNESGTDVDRVPVACCLHVVVAIAL